MYYIPGVLISIVTFPGVIVHEIAHQLFCRLFGVAVFDVKYFKTGNPAGYVVHEKPKNAYQHIMIGIGPFFVNTILGALIMLPVAIPWFKLGAFSSGNVFVNQFLAWLGVSIAMHSFPSTGDAKSMLQEIKSKETPILAKVLGYPIVLLIYIGAIGSVVWLDLVYGIAVAAIIPNLIISLLA